MLYEERPDIQILISIRTGKNQSVNLTYIEVSHYVKKTALALPNTEKVRAAFNIMILIIKSSFRQPWYRPGSGMCV
jgi:hypothetical protein